MPYDTYLVVAATYASEDDALADYDAAKALYSELGLVDTYDAAVLTKTEAGKVKVVKKHEQPTRTGAWGGLGVGLVGGALVALFPAVAVGGALLWGAAGGAALGALAGHVVGGMSRGDLKDLGEVLDEGQYGLVLVAATDMEARVEEALTRAEKRITKQLKADEKALHKEMEEAEKA